MRQRKKTRNIIYKVTNLVNKKIYIGLTIKDFEGRRSRHKYSAFNQDSQTHFHRALRKYGWDNFEWEIIEVIPTVDDDHRNMEILRQKETYWIDFYNSFKNGYNQTKGGEGTVGHIHSKESKKKMSESHADVTGEKNPMFGRVYTEEEKCKMSKVLKGIFAGDKNPRAKAVVQLSKSGVFIGDYSTAKECADAVNGENSSIVKCCKGKRLSAYGFKWMYADEYYSKNEPNTTSKGAMKNVRK